MTDPRPSAPAARLGTPDPLLSVRRGLLGRCPACGRGRLFGRFLKVAPACTACGQEFHHHRADDFPPYLVMFAVGHLVGYGIYTAETRFEDVPLWFHVALWPTLAVVLCVALLQPVKGAVIGLQYGLRMHGFGAGTTRPAGEIDGERSTRRGAEGGLAGFRAPEAVAEPAPAGRRDPHRDRPAA